MIRKKVDFYRGLLQRAFFWIQIWVNINHIIVVLTTYIKWVLLSAVSPSKCRQTSAVFTFSPRQCWYDTNKRLYTIWSIILLDIFAYRHCFILCSTVWDSQMTETDKLGMVHCLPFSALKLSIHRAWTSTLRLNRRTRLLAVFYFLKK